jgi:hypothetical protein
VYGVTMTAVTEGVQPAGLDTLPVHDVGAVMDERFEGSLLEFIGTPVLDGVGPRTGRVAVLLPHAHRILRVLGGVTRYLLGSLSPRQRKSPSFAGRALHVPRRVLRLSAQFRQLLVVI